MNVIDDLRRRGFTGRIEFYGGTFLIAVQCGNTSISETVIARTADEALARLAVLAKGVESNIGTAEGAKR